MDRWILGVILVLGLSLPLFLIIQPGGPKAFFERDWTDVGNQAEEDVLASAEGEDGSRPGSPTLRASMSIAATTLISPGQ